MTVAQRPKCSTCNSAHRGEIERKLTANEAVAKVSEWLKRSHGQYISPVGLAAHKRNHIPLVQEARAKIAEEAREALEAGVEKLVADAALLDAVAAHAMDAVKRLQPFMGRPTMPQAATFTGALREAREAVKLRDEMLRDDKRPSVDDAAGPRVTIAYAPGVAPLPDADPTQPTTEPGTPTAPAGA